MSNSDRRQFMKVGAAAAIAAVAFPEVMQGADGESPSKAVTGGVPAPHDVTRTLARYVVNARYEDLPANVRREGTRTLLNWVGVAVGGSGHEAVERATSALAPFSGPKQASLLGRRDRFDVMNAAFINGVSSHVFDFDDTHLNTAIHPGAPVMCAILALSEYQPVSGKDFLTALVLGIETECRIGNAVSPGHRERGWHITGVTGVFGAAAAAGRILKLSEQQMIYAFGLAASQPVGLLESHGSMSKAFIPGRAGANGLFGALLASKNFTTADEMISGKWTWSPAISSKQDYREITEGLGQRFEAALNTYKPFSCGVYTHPAIDAAIRLRNQHRLTADQIEAIDLRVNSRVIDATGIKAPKIGLEGKFSVYHTVAVAIINGAAGEKQFSDQAVLDPQTVLLRQRVTATIDPAIMRDQVDMTITLKDGQKLHQYIEHVVGSVQAPMTDAQLETKFSDLVNGILPKARVRQLMDTCWQVERLSTADTIAKAAVPN